MRSPIDFEKSHHYGQCRNSVDSEFGADIDSVDDSLAYSHEISPAPPPPYSAFTPARRRFILGVITAAGFFGPLCGAVYLPSLRLFQQIFKTSETAVNGTVSMYMVVFAIAVSHTAQLLHV